MTSRFALAAAAGLLLGLALTPAKAADLGGGCCADLEERVAELEATTARKGNRVVSLQVYGQVNKGLLIWDDGVDSDAFIVDNQVSTSRFGFIGKAKISPGWTAGYNMEFELDDAQSDTVTNGAYKDGVFVKDKNGDDANKANGDLVIRQNYVYVESDRLGRLSLGQASVATDGAFEVNLSNAGRTSDLNWGTNFTVRGSSSKLKDWASNLDPGRDDIIRYDSPSIYGFILSASWGDNDWADVALRFKKEFNSIRIAAAVGYAWNGTGGTKIPSTNDASFQEFGGSISVMHVPTGLYAAFSAGQKEFDEGNRDDATFWYVQAGIEKKFLPYGATTVYGEYGQYNDFLTGNVGSEATRWGLGINQKIDSAAVDVYAHATFWSFEDDLAGSNYEDLTTVMIGSRIKF